MTGPGPLLASKPWTARAHLSRCLAAPPPVRANPLPRRPSQGDSRMRTVVCRSSLCVPGHVPDTLVRRCGRQRAGAWHRRQHHDLQHRQRGPAASAAFRGAGTPGADLHPDAGRSTLRALPRQVLRLAAGCAVVRGHGDVSMLRLQGARAHWHWHRANSTCDSRQCGLFRDRQSPAGARTRLSARGGHARRQARGRPERSVLENRIRRTARTRSAAR